MHPRQGTGIRSRFQKKQVRAQPGEPQTCKQKWTSKPHPGLAGTLCGGVYPYLGASPWSALSPAHPTGLSGRPPQRGRGARTSSGCQGREGAGSTPARRGNRSCTPGLQGQPAVSGANCLPKGTLQPHPSIPGRRPSSHPQPSL